MSIAIIYAEIIFIVLGSEIKGQLFHLSTIKFSLKTIKVVKTHFIFILEYLPHG